MSLAAEPRAFATLTARFFGGVVDLLLLTLLTLALHVVWHGATAPVAEAIVALVTAFYFILGYGPVGRGYTVGKWVLGIRVVDVAGAPLTAKAATMRWLVAGGIASPLVVAAPDLLAAAPPGSTIILAVLVLLLCLFWVDGYLLLFNRGTRQSLHDIVAGSFVVPRAHQGPVAAAAVPRAHFMGAAATSVLIAALSLSVVPRMRALHDRFVSLRAAQQVVRESHGVRTLFVSPAFSVSGADTAWVVNVLAQLHASPATVAEAEDIGLALVCAVERNAPRPFRNAEVFTVITFDDGVVSSPMVRLWEASTDVSLEACGRTGAHF